MSGPTFRHAPEKRVISTIPIPPSQLRLERIRLRPALQHRVLPASNGGHSLPQKSQNLRLFLHDIQKRFRHQRRTVEICLAGFIVYCKDNHVFDDRETAFWTRLTNRHGS